MNPLFLAVGLMLIASLAVTFASLDGLRRFLAATRSIADASDLDRYGELVRRQQALAFVFRFLFGVANLLFLYGLFVDRFDLGHLVAVLVFDGVLLTLARTRLRLGKEAKSLPVRESRCRDGYRRSTTQWESKVLPEWR